MEQEAVLRDVEFDLRLRAARVPCGVVNGLFEDQVKLPPQIGIEPEFQPAGGRAEAKLDLARGEDVAGESTHALRQIANSVAPRIDRPDDVAHRIHQVARSVGDLRERFAYAVLFTAESLARDFAEDSDLREARPYVVMQILRDAQPYTFHPDQLCHSIPIRAEDRQP